MAPNLGIPLLTASKCPRATDKPMARGAEPPRSRRLRSVVARTHSTSCRVPMISMPRPWPEFTPRASCREEKREGPVSSGGNRNETPRAPGPGTERQPSASHSLLLRSPLCDPEGDGEGEGEADIQMANSKHQALSPPSRALASCPVLSRLLRGQR